MVSRQGKRSFPESDEWWPEIPLVSLVLDTIVGSTAIPPAHGLTVRSLTCEERSVTETGVSFAAVYSAQAGAAEGMFACLMR
jgi:hypothetical protein